MRYVKRLYDLIVEATSELGKDGRVFSADEVIRWVRDRYPDCPFSDSSFIMHLWGLSKNHPSAPRAWPGLYRRAFLLKLRGNNFKLLKYADEKEAVEGEALEEAELPQPTFSMEQDLERWLIKNLEQLESGLKFIDNQYSLPPVGRIDILAEDSEGQLVVIELKAGIATEQAVGQLAAYIAKLQEQEPQKKVRRILVAEDFDEKAYHAAKLIPKIKLKRYKITFQFEDLE